MVKSFLTLTANVSGGGQFAGGYCSVISRGSNCLLIFGVLPRTPATAPSTLPPLFREERIQLSWDHNSRF